MHISYQSVCHWYKEKKLIDIIHIVEKRVRSGEKETLNMSVYNAVRDTILIELSSPLFAAMAYLALNELNIVDGVIPFMLIPLSSFAINMAVLAMNVSKIQHLSEKAILNA